MDPPFILDQLSALLTPDNCEEMAGSFFCQGKSSALAAERLCGESFQRTLESLEEVPKWEESPHVVPVAAVDSVLSRPLCFLV